MKIMIIGVIGMVGLVIIKLVFEWNYIVVVIGCFEEKLVVLLVNLNLQIKVKDVFDFILFELQVVDVVVDVMVISFDKVY